jgi:hypothetical protein
MIPCMRRVASGVRDAKVVKLAFSERSWGWIALHYGDYSNVLRSL